MPTITCEKYLETVDDSHQMTTSKVHLAVLAKEAKGVKSVLEIGSHVGISAAVMALANPSATVVSVDLCDTVPQDQRVAYWESLGVRNVTPVAASARDYLPTAPRFGLVFHDAVHGDGAMPEYLRCVDVADVVAIHDFEQLSPDNRSLIEDMFPEHECTPDGRGRYLFVGRGRRK